MNPQWHIGMTLEEFERQAITYTLNYFGGSRKKAADSLGIAVRTIDNKIKQYEEEKAADENKSLTAY